MKIKFPNKIKFKKRRFDFTGLALILAEHTFGLIISLIILALVIGGWLYVKYISSLYVVPSETKIVRFEQEKYLKVLEEMSTRENNFKGANGKNFKDIFATSE